MAVLGNDKGEDGEKRCNSNTMFSPIFTSNTTSGKGKQIDLFGQLESSNGTRPKQCLLVGEMKDRRSKVGKNEIRQFLDKVAFVRTEYQLQHVICIYVCTAGFWNPAKKLLENNNIHYSTSDDALIAHL